LSLREPPISQHAAGERIGLLVLKNGEPIDVDNDNVSITITRRSDEQDVASGEQAEKEGTGRYFFNLKSDQVSLKDSYTYVWDYQIDGEDKTRSGSYVVVDPMPYWDMLSEYEKEVVFNIYHKVSDNFDSMEGGPYLWEVIQAAFNPFETISRLMHTDAITYINFSKQPAFFPPFQVGVQARKKLPLNMLGLLDKAVSVEFYKHLSRSYIEIPQVQNVATGRMERRDYRERWRQQWQDEKEELDSMLRLIKRRYALGATKRSLLVYGGAIPSYMANPARPYFRFAIARY